MKPVLLIDFGSTYTKLTAVDVENECLLGTAASYTTVQTDINDGLQKALSQLEQKIGKLDFIETYACSSAAGGLRMITSGLVPELTGEAAKLASLGAGAKVTGVYAFQLTEENLERLRQANSHLTNLTKRAYDRIGDIGAVKYYMADCEDDGYDVESHVRFIYQGDDSVLKLDDDDYYGSNFTLMIKALAELYIAKGQENIIYARLGKNRLDDDESWLEEPFCKWKDWLGDIIICYAVHDLTSHKAYSVPDLLRLDSFLCESTVTFQSITRQNDTRFKAQN